jgi:2-oxoglutarate ferredoxin oxidoreductase subunit alpha
LTAPYFIPDHRPPGTRILSGKYPVLSGLEHDEYGHPTASPKLHAAMTTKRRKKLQTMAASLPTPRVYGPEDGDILLVGWGSTVGVLREAVDRYRTAGDKVSTVHIRHISPLPPGLDLIFGYFKQIVVVEMNDEGLYGYGQLAALLRARFLDKRIRSITKTDGLTWKVKEIRERVRPFLAQFAGRR